MEESEPIVIVDNYWTELADEEGDVYPDDELATCSVLAARIVVEPWYPGNHRSWLYAQDY